MQLIEDFKKGDKRSFQLIFDEMYQRLCAYSSRYLYDDQEVEDLVQDSFITLWNKRGDFDHINAIKSFLYTSVRNKCLNVLKHQTVIKEHESRLIYELENSDSEQAIVAEEYYGRLYSEIKELPEGSQKIMILALRGLKNREIAEELGISENTVKTQKKIAYAKLKERLSPVMFSWLLSL
ncbi:MAG: hypothetical protein CMB80_05195 [Flammeovirgaceae bacterium]|nr:hypothetical protein [Flammeovirgaceae bacterium]MBE62709.1 hypothetical protein [Flammeovirgaceae bacterium]HCX23000.1 RNA polymerase sigma-70 factor [Cytophagales bacterium]|tara:strand:- start:4041 stop:4580 length:540 start_codon:yes stop_codon:yes gene_type:complete